MERIERWMGRVGEGGGRVEKLVQMNIPRHFSLVPRREANFSARKHARKSGRCG